MKESFKPIKWDGNISITLTPSRKWNASKRDVLEAIIKVAERYEYDGYTLTLRQLYYQLVAKDLIPNHLKSYKKLSSLKDELVYGGALDWDVFEDRGRVPHRKGFDRNIKGALNLAVDTYCLNPQQYQDVHVEVWCEKDAISSILSNVTYDMGITLCVNKGYSSSTAIYGAYTRFSRMIEAGKRVVVLYFGDHDPSGLDMVRDIDKRIKFMLEKGERKEGTTMEEMKDDWLWVDDEENEGELTYSDEAWELEKTGNFKESEEESDYYSFDEWKAFFHTRFQIIQIGLTMEQIEEYNPPPNPAKLTDPRAAWYVEKFGAVSWEVDALEPAIMEEIVREHIENTLDMGRYSAVLEREAKEKAKIREIVSDIKL